VTLGFDRPADYVAGNPPYFGAVCGRFANRIAGGRFELAGAEYRLATNNGPNHLHGGQRGFDRRVWTVIEMPGADGSRVELQHVSPDGEEGYPGTLTTTVRCTLTEDNALELEYAATTDRATPVNLTNHTYFNLGGPGTKDVWGHEFEIRALQYLPTDAGLIPTGEIRSVKDSPLDFRKPRLLGEARGSLATGYDHCIVLDAKRGAGWGARVRYPANGRVLEMFTTEPGVQLYSGYFLEGVPGRRGARHGRYEGFCLEAQHYPDSPNKPVFPSTILHPGQTYRQKTAYRFSVE
jgi:aldose 1-epimerase